MDNSIRIFAGASVRKTGGEISKTPKHYKSELGLKKGDSYFCEVDDLTGDLKLTVQSQYDGEVYISLTPEAMEWLINEYIELNAQNSSAKVHLARIAKMLLAARDRIVATHS